MKHFLLLIVLSFSAIPVFAQLKYKLPDVTLTSNQICGKKICAPGNIGYLLHLTLTPYSPSLTKATSAKDVALQVLGRTLSAETVRKSLDFSTCSELSDNPFKLTDIENVKFEDGRSIDYSRKEKLEIDVKAAADANIKQLMGLTNDIAKLERLRAKIEASYQKIKGKDLTIAGKYSEWQLSQDALQKIKKGDGFTACRKFIADNNQRIILAVGLVYFDIKYEENSLDELASMIDAELAKEGINASLSFSFKKEVTKRFKSSSEIYQIIIIRHAGINAKELALIETPPRRW